MQDGRWPKLNPFIADDVAIDPAANYSDTDLNECLDLCAGVNNQGSLLRRDFSGYVSVYPQHLFKTDFSVKLGRRIVFSIAGTLFDVDCSTGGVHLSGNNPINRHDATISCFAGDHRHARLKLSIILS